MRWEEFYPDARVPRHIIQLVKDGVLFDSSSHETSCPSFSAKLKSGKVVTLKVSNPDLSKRDTRCLTRFTLLLGRDFGHGQEIYFTNDMWDLIIEFWEVYDRNGGATRFRLMGIR